MSLLIYNTYFHFLSACQYESYLKIKNPFTIFIFAIILITFTS